MWTQTRIADKTADVYQPGDGPPRFGLVFLHGIGRETLAEAPIFTELLRRERLACICPHGQTAWWADRVCPQFDAALTPERYLLDSIIPSFRERWGLGPRSIGLCGISMGGQGALRLAFKHPRLFTAVASISSALDHYEWYGRGLDLDDMYDCKEQCRQDGALLHIHPAHFPPHVFFCVDPTDADWMRGNDRLHEKLTALGVAHECDLTTSAGGHSWDYFNHMAPRAVRFLVAGLEIESRRLL